MKAVNLLPPDYSGSQRVTVGARLGRHPVAVGGAGRRRRRRGCPRLHLALGVVDSIGEQQELTSLKVQLAAVNKLQRPSPDGVRRGSPRSTRRTRRALPGTASCRGSARVLPRTSG